MNGPGQSLAGGLQLQGGARLGDELGGLRPDDVDAEHLAAPLAANWAAEAVALAGDYTHLLGPSTTLGRDLMPRVAALLGVNQVSDIMEVTAPNSFKRPIYAGNAIVDVTVPDGLKVVATARTASWKTAPGGGSAAVETVAAANAAVDHTRFVGMEIEGSERPDVQSAARVVAGGRALGSEEQFELIYRFADRIGAGVGGHHGQLGEPLRKSRELLKVDLSREVRTPAVERVDEDRKTEPLGLGQDRVAALDASLPVLEGHPQLHAAGAGLHVQKLHEERESHREVDVALRDVQPDTLADQGETDQDQE